MHQRSEMTYLHDRARTCARASAVQMRSRLREGTRLTLCACLTRCTHAQAAGGTCMGQSCRGSQRSLAST